MIHWIELHPYWSCCILIYLIGIGLVVYAFKIAPTMDDEGNFIKSDKQIKKELFKQETKYH